MTETLTLLKGPWGQPDSLAISHDDLAALDAITKAGADTVNHEVRIIGRGRFSTVLEWRRSLVVKELPLFPSRQAFDDYTALLEKQFNILGAAGVGVLATSLRGRAEKNGAWAAYLIQPRAAAERLLPEVLRT